MGRLLRSRGAAGKSTPSSPTADVSTHLNGCGAGPAARAASCPVYRAAYRQALDHVAPLAELDQFLPYRDHDGLHPGVDLKLLQDVAHVILDRVLGDEQFLGNVAVVHAPGHQLEHLHLAIGKLGCRYLLCPFLVIALRECGELRKELARHRRIDKRLAAADSPDNLGDLVQRDVLEQVAAGTRPDRLEQVLFLVADRQYDDLRTRRCLLHRTAGFNSAALRHADIHENHIRQGLGSLLDCLSPITRLTDQLDVVLGRENHLQATPEQRVIINDEGADRIGTPPGARCTLGGCEISAHGTSSPPRQPCPAVLSRSYLACRRVLTLCRPAVLPPRLAVQPRHTGLRSAALIAMRNSPVMPSCVSACAPDLVTTFRC